MLRAATGVVAGLVARDDWEIVPQAARLKTDRTPIAESSLRMVGRECMEQRLSESIGRALRFDASRRFTLVSYPWTRVPGDEPPLDRFQLRLLPAADLFMALMWSRPGGLSLRNAWVTPATLALSLAVLFLGLPAAVVALLNGARTGSVVAAGIGLVAAVLSAGAGSVALYGVRQRLLAVAVRTPK